MRKFELLPEEPTKEQLVDALLDLPPRLIRKIALRFSIEVEGRFKRQQRIEALSHLAPATVGEVYNLTIQNREHKVQRFMEVVKALPAFFSIFELLIARAKTATTAEDYKEIIEDLTDAYEEVEV